MEGTVTISLKDYEKLKKADEIADHYYLLAEKQILTLEKVEELFQSMEKEPGLLEEVEKRLDEWYG